MPKNQNQRTYEKSLEEIKNQIRKARNMNRDAHIDWLKEVHRLIDREIAELEEPDHYYQPDSGL